MMKLYVFCRRRTLVYFFGAFLVLFLGACERPPESEKKVGDNTLRKVMQSGIIQAGYIVWAPTVIKDPNTGKLTGHFVDTMEYIANEIGADIEWHEANWDTFVAGLQSGKFDVAVAGTYLTIPRAKSVSFTHPLFFLGNSAIVEKNDNRFSAPMDLNLSGLKIACTQGTGEETWAKGNLTLAKIISLPGPNLELPLLEVINGRADVALTDTYTAKKFEGKISGVKALFVEHPFNLTAVSWTVRKDDMEWKDFLDASIRYLLYSGRIKKFEDQHNATWIHQAIVWE